MANIPITINIKSSDNVMYRDILRAVRKELISILERSIPDIKKNVYALINTRIYASQEIQSLLDGVLRAEMGLVRPAPIVDDIVKAIVAGTKVKFNKPRITSVGIAGGLTISILKSDMKEALGVDGASFVSERGENVEWLNWLLTRGDDIIIRHYNIDFNVHQGDKKKSSRTNEAIMSEGQGWRVNPSFSGILEDNILTRALENIDNEITDIIITAISKRS